MNKYTCARCGLIKQWNNAKLTRDPHDKIMLFVLEKNKLISIQSFHCFRSNNFIHFFSLIFTQTFCCEIFVRQRNSIAKPSLIHRDLLLSLHRIEWNKWKQQKTKLPFRVCWTWRLKKKQSNLAAGKEASSKAEGQKNDQSQSSETVTEYFEQFSTLPAGLHKYVSNDLIGTPLEDIDPVYKDKQVNTNSAHLKLTLILPLFFNWSINGTIVRHDSKFFCFFCFFFWKKGARLHFNKVISFGFALFNLTRQMNFNLYRFSMWFFYQTLNSKNSNCNRPDCLGLEWTRINRL